MYKIGQTVQTNTGIGIFRIKLKTKCFSHIFFNTCHYPQVLQLEILGFLYFSGLFGVLGFNFSGIDICVPARINVHIPVLCVPRDKE